MARKVTSSADLELQWRRHGDHLPRTESDRLDQLCALDAESHLSDLQTAVGLVDDEALGGYRRRQRTIQLEPELSAA